MADNSALWFDKPGLSDISTPNVSDSPRSPESSRTDPSERPRKGSPRTQKSFATSTSSVQALSDVEGRVLVHDRRAVEEADWNESARPQASRTPRRE